MLTLERKWDRRVDAWHSHVTSAAAFGQVLDQLISLSSPQPTDACVDLGAGTGFVTTALAPLVSSVLAVDISASMAASLAERAAHDGLANVSTEVSDLGQFQLRLPASISSCPATRCTTCGTPTNGPWWPGPPAGSARAAGSSSPT